MDIFTLTTRLNFSVSTWIAQPSQNVLCLHLKNIHIHDYNRLHAAYWWPSQKRAGERHVEPALRRLNSDTYRRTYCTFKSLCVLLWAFIRCFNSACSQAPCFTCLRDVTGASPANPITRTGWSHIFPFDPQALAGILIRNVNYKDGLGAAANFTNVEIRHTVYCFNGKKKKKVNTYSDMNIRYV